VLRLLAGGKGEREILSEYPDLQAEDIRECLRFAAASAMEREMPLSVFSLRFLIDSALPPGLAGLLLAARYDAWPLATTSTCCFPL
jgi:hypothetical protein